METVGWPAKTGESNQGPAAPQQRRDEKENNSVGKYGVVRVPERTPETNNTVRSMEE